ncbi:MAG: ATP synthase subunit I [Gammaproteobacteria bacterium]
MAGPEDNTQKNRAAAYKTLAFEAIITAILALLLSIGVDIEAAWSSALGGLAYIVPNACFARYAFRHSAAESARLAVSWFYVGEAVKVITTVLIFAACFLLIENLNAAAFFLTYILMLILNLRGLYVLMNR